MPYLMMERNHSRILVGRPPAAPAFSAFWGVISRAAEQAEGIGWRRSWACATASLTQWLNGRAVIDFQPTFGQAVDE
jgi:hypothetical protein